MRPPLWTAAAAVLAAGGVGLGLLTHAPADDAPVTARAVALVPQHPDRRQVGELTYAGGLTLTSSRTARFGGVSGLIVEPGSDGRQHAQAITDDGDFLAFDLALDGQGRLTGVSDLRYTPLLGDDAKPLPNKHLGDAEDLTRLADGQIAVSFEQLHRVMNIGRPFDPPKAPQRLNAPKGAQRLPANTGFEALAAYGDRLLEGAEDGRMWSCPIQAGACVQVHGWGGPEPHYQLTGLDRLPGADAEFVAVYRKFALLEPRFSALVAHVRLDGRKAVVTPIAEIAPPMSVRNMEGVAAVPMAAGVRIYLISDNGFSEDDPTLLLAFDWTRRAPGSHPALNSPTPPPYPAREPR